MSGLNYAPSKILFEKLDSKKRSLPAGSFAEIRLPSGISNRSGDIEGFIDPIGQIGVVIPLSEELEERFVPDTNGRSISFTKDKLAGQSCARLLLREPNLRPVFEVFVGNVLDESWRKPDQAAIICSSLLKKWKSLFVSKASVGLSAEQQVGLLAELEVLKHLLDEIGEIAFTRWTGPDCNKHDFCLDDKDIEVKASTGSNGLFISVHGGDQLTFNPDLPLDLCVRKYAAAPNGRLSLSDTVEILLQDERVSDYELLDILASIGYTHCSERGTEVGTSEDKRFDFVAEYWFRVGDDFPSLKEIGDSRRVQQVEYRLDLSEPETVPGFINCRFGEK